MRPTLLVSAIFSVGQAACAHPAYGPSADERLEIATDKKPSMEGVDVAKVTCSDMAIRFAETKNSEQAENERLQGLVDLHNLSRERLGLLDETVNKNPDLIYGEVADTVRKNVNECRVLYADVHSDLDKFLREVTDMLVVQEIQNGKKSETARLDLALVRTAIAALDPEDKDLIIEKVSVAEKKLVQPSENISSGKSSENSSSSKKKK